MYLNMLGLAVLSKACPVPTLGALTACGYFLRSSISLGLATWLISVNDGCLFVCCRISLAAQVGAGRGKGPVFRASSEVGLELIPFCWRTGWNLHPRDEKSVHDSHSSCQHDLGACAWSLPALPWCWDLLNPPASPGSFL